MYPASAVVIGDKNVNTVASESDKYCKEKYTPNNPKNLRDDKIKLMVKGVRTYPLNPLKASSQRTSLGPNNGSGTLFQYLNKA